MQHQKLNSLQTKYKEYRQYRMPPVSLKLELIGTFSYLVQTISIFGQCNLRVRPFFKL